MFDWQVSEEEQPLPKWAEEERPRPARRVRGWYLFGGLLLLLVMVGLFVFRWRLGERTEAMEGDLRAFIRHEEQQRVFGFTEQADKLMVSNAPQQWQEAYQFSFVKADEVQPIELEVEEIKLEGTAAYVTVRLDDVPQVRFYRLVGQEWRRAPLFDAFWGEERQIELADDGITIVYPAGEEPFAQTLADELPILLQQWPTKQRALTPFTIKIEPTEFAPALLYVSQNDDTRQIVLNSPKLIVPEHADADADGEATVRLVLADALLEEVNLDYDTQQSLLPTATTFLGALRNTLVLRWALPDEAIPRQIWRDKMADLPKSPFLGQWKINRGEMLLARVWEPHVSEAMSLLIADYLYDQHGSQALQKIIKQLPSAQSWDRIFYEITRDYTIEVEEAALWPNSPSKTVNSIIQLPFLATVLDVDTQKGVLEVEVAGQDRLSIETDDSTLLDAERMNLAAECAMLHKRLIITEGDWLQIGQTLQARQLMVNDPQPAILPQNMTLARSDTLAYLAEQRNDAQQGRGVRAFLALSEDGTTTHLSTLPPEITAGWHMRSNIPWPARFLLTVSVPNCEQTWLLMYDPRQGVVDHWLTSSSDSLIFPSFMWRPQEGDIVLLNFLTNNQSSYKERSYLSAKPGSPLRLLGEAGSLPHPLGWFEDKMVTLSQERKAVQLINQKSGEVTKSIPLASQDAGFFFLSENSKWLFYTNKSTEKPALHRVSLESGEEQFLFSAPDDELLAPVSARNHRLLLQAGQEVFGRLFPTHFLLLDLKSSEQPAIIMDIPYNEFVTSALLCADGRVLISSYERGQSEVRMWEPDGSTKSLLKSDKQLTLLSCR